jgi:phosphomannomutase/phosphoglucomutase
VEEACAGLGARTIYTAVGAPYLSEKMAQLGRKAVSGGEEVGGIIWPDFSIAKDGIYAAVKMAQMACERSLSEMAAELPLYFNSKCKIEAEGEKKKAALEAARKHAEKSGGKIMLIDGVRVDFEEGWVIVRASGTENAVRVFAEGKTQSQAESLMKEYVEIVNGALG